MSNDTQMKARALAFLALILAASILVACGSDDEPTTADAPDYEAAIAKAPAELASLYANGSELIEGGQQAYDDTLASVSGYPAVVNTWASWCAPCREEFPYFQSQAAQHLDEVAFFGIDLEDAPAAYETFLRDNPVPYPSVADPDRQFGEWTDQAFVGQPNTLFYDRDGLLLYAKQGPYTSEDELAADIEKYALSS